MESQVVVNTTIVDSDAHKYPEFLESIKEHFHSVVDSRIPLLETDAEGLFDIFLAALPDSDRQHYTCNACRSFVNHFGGLVTVSEDGDIIPVMWSAKKTPDYFIPAVAAVRDKVFNAKITGVFVSDCVILGRPVTGEWHHMSVTLPVSMVNRLRTKTAGQVAAEKLEDYRMLNRSLAEYSQATIDQAVTLLQTDSLVRSEKCLPVAEWFSALHKKRAETKNLARRENIIWRAVATAPTGFCHVRSSMIGTLLDDIVAGLSFNDVSRKFADKMDGLKYQRPQAAPSAGNIAQAEKIVEQLGIQQSLIRRFARLEELELIWAPKNVKEFNAVSEGGVFSHLTPKGVKEQPKMELPTKTMTWKKFLETVLPTAETIEHLVKNRDNFIGILTAVYPDAPPILQWDNDAKRNPFSWYVYHGGSLASQWNLSTSNRFHKVTGITYQPSMWYDDYANHGKSVCFILEGAKDSAKPGVCLFPEILRSELREVRSTIEAYSKGATPEGREEATACGLRLQEGLEWNAIFRVTSNGTTIDYKLDRWD